MVPCWCHGARIFEASEVAARHHPAIAAMLPESCGYPATHHDPAKLRKAGPSWLINEHDRDDEHYPRSQMDLQRKHCWNQHSGVTEGAETQTNLKLGESGKIRWEGRQDDMMLIFGVNS